MPRSIDHLVIPAHDLDAEAAAYRRLGFQVGARNRHPWGTQNHIVQFDGAFLELIGLGEGFEAAPAEPATFSFAGFVAAYLARRQGLAMLVLRSADAEADRQQFARRGLGAFQRFDFARKALNSDGREVDVAFSLAFAASPALPEIGFFVCQQHFPENFWNAAAQVHPNGAAGVTGLAFAHDRPADCAGFLSGFLETEAIADGDGLALAVNGASVTIATPERLAERFGVDPARLRGPALVAAEIGVADLAATASLLTASGVGFQLREGRLIVDADASMGAILTFAPAG